MTPNIIKISFVYVLLNLFACSSAEDNQTDIFTPVSDESKIVRFIAVGDSGTGSSDQYSVANSMQNKCDAKGCDFILLLGDNIYDDGVISLSDEQFNTKFELPYQNINVPFYVALGNHDYGGNGAGTEYYKSQYQVDYSDVSSKWNMPHHSYEFTEYNVSFIALDTNGQMFSVVSDDSNQRQKVSTWISNANTDWKIVFGHHPYKSNGPHGNAGKYDGTSSIPIISGDGVKSFSEDIWCGKVDLYISGHDHSRQWLDVTCQGTALVISGAGAKTTDLSNLNASKYQSNSLGFLYVVIDAGTLTAEFIDVNGNVNFTQVMVK